MPYYDVRPVQEEIRRLKERVDAMSWDDSFNTIMDILDERKFEAEVEISRHTPPWWFTGDDETWRELGWDDPYELSPEPPKKIKVRRPPNFFGRTSSTGPR